MKETIFIASDHAGFDLKEQIIDSKNNFVDLGTKSNERVDYPDYANQLVSEVKKNNNAKGILICGSGIGMSIAANRDKKIRAGIAFNAEIAKLMRQHNDANVLVLSGRYMSIHEALKCIENFLNTNFDGGRHIQRVNKLNK